MATRKKTEKQTIKEVSKLIAEETLQATESSKKKPKKSKAESVKEVYPKVVTGNHLIVTTYENGKTELVWDDEALLKEVQDAILSVEQAKKPARKSTRKTKAENA